MKMSNRAAPAVLGQVEEAVARQRMAATSVWQCLVVSASPARRNLLFDAAESAGWNATACADCQYASAEFETTIHHFAIVDLDLRGQTPAGFRDFVAMLAEDPGRILLGVCGHEADPAEEVWARQLGIWLYLPGATNASEISLLCEQAMLVVKKQRSDQTAPVT